jgi:hypothetical protein
MKSQKANGSTGSRDRMNSMVNKINGGPGDPPSKSSQLPELEITFNPTPREKVLIAANQAVSNKKVSWRSSKGGSLGTFKNKAKAFLGNKDFRSDGKCTNNTCVETVADYHKKAGVPFSNTSDNRTLKKQLKSGELGYSKTTTPKKGDLVQFEKNKKISGGLFSKDKVIKNRPFHVGIVSDLNKKGRPTKYIGTSGHNSPNLKRGTTFKLNKKNKETKIRKKHTPVYYTKDEA